jgi:ribosomal protein S18 acetylase RimI-like enzyme
MSTPQPIHLTPIPTAPATPEFQSLLTWPFAEQPFYEGQIRRVLESDILNRLVYGFCRVWVYRDPDANTVGFSTLDVCREYDDFTNKKLHAYIPVLVVHPGHRHKGHGRSIVQHLIAEAALIAQSSEQISDLLFLDVYAANGVAISLYERSGFMILNPDAPILDPVENNEPYFIMAKNVSLAPG